MRLFKLSFFKFFLLLFLFGSGEANLGSERYTRISLYAQTGGESVSALSMNFDVRPALICALRVGFGTTMMGDFISFTYPVSLSFLGGKPPHHVELGFGFTYVTWRVKEEGEYVEKSNQVFSVIVNYRFQGSIIFRIGAAYWIDPRWHLLFPIPGFSIGVSF